MPARVVTPAAWIEVTIGMTLAAKAAAFSLADCVRSRPRLRSCCGSPAAWSFFAARAAAVRREITLLLSQGGVEVQHEGARVDAELSHPRGAPAVYRDSALTFDARIFARCVPARLARSAIVRSYYSGEALAWNR